VVRYIAKKNMTLRIMIIAGTLFAVLFVGIMLGMYYSKNVDSFDYQGDRNIPSKTGHKQDFEIRYDSYSEQDKRFVQMHIDKALAKLDRNADEFEIAAAINDYLYQYLILKANSGGSAKILREGHAICGGAMITMAEMLHSLGIKSKYAFLLGVPDQGSHSLLEVFFNDGRLGLFDPIFGILWFSPETNEPVSIMELLERPSLSNTTLYKSLHKRRKKLEDPVLPFKGFEKTYAHRPNYKEKNYDPYACFSQRSGGGLANEGMKSFIRIPLRLGVVLGSKTWDKKNGLPWESLFLLKDENGNYIFWAYQLGQVHEGYDIKHIYDLKGLSIERDYSLRLYYSASANNTVLSIQFIDPAKPTSYRRVKRLGFNPNSFKSGVIEIPFISTKSEASILVDAKGVIILHAIELIAVDH